MTAVATSAVQVWVPLSVAARRLGVSWSSAILLARSGRIVARLVGRARWFFLDASLRRYCKHHRRSQRGAA
jgi:hypothetical protein